MNAVEILDVTLEMLPNQLAELVEGEMCNIEFNILDSMAGEGVPEVLKAPAGSR